MKKRYVIFTAIIAIIAICGLLVPEQQGIWTLSDNISAADIAWMITATIFVLMMTPGLSFFYGGMVRKKNVISTILQSIIAMGIISVLWVFVGFSLCFGEDVGGLGIIGNPATYFMFHNVGGAATDDLSTRLGLTIPLALYALFPFFGLYDFYGAVLHFRLLPACAYDLAPRRPFLPYARQGFCGRHCGSRFERYRRLGWRNLFGAPSR